MTLERILYSPSYRGQSQISAVEIFILIRYYHRSSLCHQYCREKYFRNVIKQKYLNFSLDLTTSWVSYEPPGFPVAAQQTTNVGPASLKHGHLPREFSGSNSTLSYTSGNLGWLHQSNPCKTSTRKRKIKLRRMSWPNQDLSQQAWFFTAVHPECHLTLCKMSEKCV